MASLGDPVCEVYADGGVEIEEAGPCRRLIFHRRHNGSDKIGVIAIVMPADEVMGLLKQLSVSALLAPDDIGAPKGHG